MGILSSIKGAVSSIVTSEKKYIADIKANPLKAVGSKIVETQVNLAKFQTGAAAVILGAPKIASAVAANPVAAVKTGGAIIKGTAATALAGSAAVAGYNFFSASPTAASYAKSLPEKLLVTAPKSAGKVIENPSLSSIGGFIKDNPEAVAAAAAAALLLGGKAAAGLSTWRNTAATTRSAEATEELLKQGNNITKTPDNADVLKDVKNLLGKEKEAREKEAKEEKEAREKEAKELKSLIQDQQKAAAVIASPVAATPKKKRKKKKKAAPKKKRKAKKSKKYIKRKKKSKRRK